MSGIHVERRRNIHEKSSYYELQCDSTNDENLLNYSDEEEYEDESIDKTSFENEKKQSSNWKVCFFLIIVAVVAVVPMVYFNSGVKVRECSFAHLIKKYPAEETKLWNYLKHVNENILNHQSDKPAVLLLVHNGNGNAETVVRDIADTSAECFGSSSVIKNLGFDTKEAIKDYGHVVDTYKKKISEGNVIFIGNLNKIPGEAAKALHSICDTVTPLVKKVIILLLLKVEEQNLKQKLIDTVEDKLKELWQEKMEPYELIPLITRVTDQVYLIRTS